MKSYRSDEVVKSIKNDESYISGYLVCLQVYNDKDWCDQFLSYRFNNFEIVIVKDVNGIDDGFYLVDTNYTKFIQSQFIQNLLSQIVKKEMNKKMILIADGFCIKRKTYSKSIDKFFINYIRNNTIDFFTYEKFVDEFNPYKIKPSNNGNYQSHTKSLHTVKGFWKNQPYGSRSNPTYRLIWIDSFKRGS